MTRGEIREAIKKVFFEEIEPDSSTKKMNFYPKTSSKKYKSLDKKQNFRSRHEALAYHVFDNEGVIDQIENEPYRFKKICNKIPDFVWENKKIIIEVAGMDDSFSPGYWQRLKKAKPCFEKQGYTVYIIDTRTGSPYYNYIKFYKHLCDLLGFTPKPEIKDDIFSYVGDPIDLAKRNQEIIQYKKDNPNATQSEIADRFNTPPSIVFRILKQAGLTTPSAQTQSQTQARNQEIAQYKKDNLNVTRQEIANKFNLSIIAVARILKKAGLTTSSSQTQAQNQEIIQYKTDNPDATLPEIADEFNLSISVVFKALKQAGLTTPLSQIQAQTQARNQEIIQYKKDNPNATQPKIADKFNLSVDTVARILKKAKESNPTNEQSINYKTMTLKELREIIKKALKESTIDVPGDPNKLTPQQKSAEISKARRTTRKPNLGTAIDPVDFI